MVRPHTENGLVVKNTKMTWLFGLLTGPLPGFSSQVKKSYHVHFSTIMVKVQKFRLLISNTIMVWCFRGQFFMVWRDFLEFWKVSGVQGFCPGFLEFLRIAPKTHYWTVSHFSAVLWTNCTRFVSPQ